MIFGKEFPSKVIDEKSALKGRKEPRKGILNFEEHISSGDLVASSV